MAVQCRWRAGHNRTSDTTRVGAGGLYSLVVVAEAGSRRETEALNNEHVVCLLLLFLGGGYVSIR
jgi:hypothetical protein